MGEKSLKLGENTQVDGHKGSDVRCSGECRVQIGENTQGRGNMKWNAVQIRGQGAEQDLSCETLQRKWSALDWWPYSVHCLGPEVPDLGRCW